MGWGDVIGAIGGIIGAGIGAAGQIGANMMTFGQNKELQQRQFDYQERMSNTSYQRAVADMENAGINPLMAVGSGGATTPSGASSSMSTPDIAGALSSGAAMAMQLRQAGATVSNLKEEANLKKEQAKTEETKRNQMTAETGLTKLNSAYQQILNSQLPERFKNEMKELVSRTFANNMQAAAAQTNAAANILTAKANQQNAETNRMVGKEQAKYTRERARGYTESWTDSSNAQQNVGVTGVGTSRGYTRTHSTTR